MLDLEIEKKQNNSVETYNIYDKIVLVGWDAPNAHEASRKALVVTETGPGEVLTILGQMAEHESTKLEILNLKR